MTLPLPPNSILIFSGMFVLLLLFIRINAPASKREPFYKGKVFGKDIVLAFPAKAEQILLVFYVLFFAIMDVAQNKVIDKGIDYQVIVFGNITANILFVWQIFLILMHVVLMALFVMSLQSKATSKAIDIFVGTLAFFGIAILLSGVIVQIYSPTIYFLGIAFRSIDFYHMGVYLSVFYTLYLAFTK